jgi:hypothetical protein
MEKHKKPSKDASWKDERKQRNEKAETQEIE